MWCNEGGWMQQLKALFKPASDEPKGPQRSNAGDQKLRKTPAYFKASNIFLNVTGGL